VLVLDISMPDTSGLALMQRLFARAPDARIIIFSMHDDAGMAERAMDAGARGYVTKSNAPEVLVKAVYEVAAGRLFLSPDIAHELATHALDDPLTERELTILRLVADGHQNKAIARSLDLSVDTVKAHLKTIFAKLGVDDRTHAVTVAARRGFIVR